MGRFSRHRRESSIHGKQLVREVRAQHHARLHGRIRLRPGCPCLVQLLHTIGGSGQPAKAYVRAVTFLDCQHDGRGDAACLSRGGARVLSPAVVAAGSLFDVSEFVVGRLHGWDLATGQTGAYWHTPTAARTRGKTRISVAKPGIEPVFVLASVGEVSTVCRAEGLLEAVAGIHRDVLGLDLVEFPTE